MKISVIVPVYNCINYLSECIDSLLVEKDLLELEIILIDDGSVDGSYQVCDDYASKYHQIKVVHTINQGVSIARNIGLEKSTGDWIMFVDGDDRLESNTFSTLIDKTEFYRYDMTRFWAYRFSDDGGSSDFQPNYSDSLDEYRNLIIGRDTMLGVCGGIYKRALFTDYSICFDPEIHYGEDWLVLYKIACHAKSFKFETSKLYAYRINLNSVTEKKINFVRIDAFVALDLILAYAKNKSIDVDSDKLYRAKCILRCDAIKNALFSNSRNIYRETKEVLNRYAKLSLLDDIHYSSKLKQKLGFILYRIMLFIYRV